MSQNSKHKKSHWYFTAFITVNLIAILVFGRKELNFVNKSLNSHARHSIEQTEDVMQNYIHSFQLFSRMMAREIEVHPDPDAIWDFLKQIDSQMLKIEGDTFDGLYMYYNGRYLYSWDTPYSQYEDTGYMATERPWYKDAVAGQGKIVFTPPYMSYANHYILSTVSQLQPDGETVFAYDIKMGDIQNLVSSLQSYEGEQMMIFDASGTVIGSTDPSYLGGNLYGTAEESEAAYEKALAALGQTGELTEEQRQKLEEEAASAAAFHEFRKSFDEDLALLSRQESRAQLLGAGQKRCFGILHQGENYHVMILVPFLSMLHSTVQIWLLPLLILEILLIYVLSQLSREGKNRELKAAYMELGQTQKRLELALAAAQKAAAIDDLTGMMNFKSFRKGIGELLNAMDPEESGILIMIDVDHFKAVNDNYGHMMGDEVIKLTAQMIIGRIRTIDFASRLHGDEFAIFIDGTRDYSVARRIMEDINLSIVKEAKKRNMPSVTLSSGAVIARHGDTYTNLAKEADAALYLAKETHNGGFASAAKK